MIDVDKSITKSLEKLKEHIDAQMESIRNITIKEESFLENLLGNDRGNLNELKKLGKLEKVMSSIEKSAAAQNEKLDHLSEGIAQLTKVLQNQNQVDFKLPETIKYLSFAFFGSGAAIGIGYCFWVIYNLL